MSKINQTLFQTSDPIVSLEDSSFDYNELHLNILYGENEGQIYPPKLQTFAPAVICSPRKTGKTTQGNFIYKVLQHSKDKICYLTVDALDINSVNSEQDFRELLIEKFESIERESTNFADLIKTSNIILNTEGVKVIFISHAETLHKESLNWLLHGVKELEKDKTIKKLKVLIIIDGSFAVETLTGPNSRFPLTQLFPPEFVKSEQKEFVLTRFNSLGKILSPYAHEAIWEATEGDKYFTQAVCMRINQSNTQTITEDTVKEHTENFIQEEGYKDNLKPHIYKAFYLLSENFNDNDLRLRKLLDNVSEDWHSTPLNIRKILYEGGIIRRINSGSVSLRAPIIRKIYAESESRVRKVKALLNSRFSPETIHPKYSIDAQKVVQNIIENSYSGMLKGLQVGHGVKKSNREIVINVATLQNGQYTGDWEVSTSSDIPIGSYVICLFQTSETKENNRTSSLDIFPCIE